MSPILLTALLALSAAVAAQEESNVQITWAAVVFAHYGEKIPDATAGPYELTPYGANQMYNAGQIIQGRYIWPLPNETEGITSYYRINGLSSTEIDNSQMYILSTDDEFVSASALAFMQALYPPVSLELDPDAIMSDSSLKQYPLGGYQYPNVQTVSSLDFNYLWLAGNIGCQTQSNAEVELLSSPAFVEEMEATSEFYQSFSDGIFWDFDPSTLNYGNAWELYEYALYQYNHNVSADFNATFTYDDLSQFQSLASQQQFTYNTPTSNSTINAMAGRTLASEVLQQFLQNIESYGVSDKLTLMFGSFEPFLAFFALSNLSTGPSASRFNSLPEHGSVMVFELFSFTTPAIADNGTIPFPDKSDLFVRFLFRNGTEDTNDLIEYALFGNGNSQDVMTYSEFVDGMGAFSLNDIVDWCVECAAPTPPTLFCEAILDNVSNETASAISSSKGLSPVIAGVVGATITLGLGIVTGIALCLFGFRLDYHSKDGNKGPIADLGVLKRSPSGNGGFKGAEKLASDTDLALKGGAGATVIRHERVGSWELHESPNGDSKHSSLDKEIESGRVVSNADYGRDSEDAIGHVNPFGDPVKPLDQV